MAWSTITDIVLQVGKPIRALTLRLLRDNITALANGDAGAPRIQTAAYAYGSVTGGVIAAETITSYNIQNGSIQGYDISSETITSYNIQNGSIGGGDIAAAQIQAYHLQTGTNERDFVMNMVAYQDLSRIGTMVWGEWASNSAALVWGNTYAGSNIRPAGLRIAGGTGSTVTRGNAGSSLTGTWRALGTENTGNQTGQTLFLRIA